MTKTIIVVDRDLSKLESNWEVVNFSHYLADYPKIGEPKTRVINLCDATKYLSVGYYCSLLAEARGHRVLPSVSTINDLRTSSDANASVFFSTHSQVLTKSLGMGESQDFLIMFGWVQDRKWQALASRLFNKYQAPLLLVTFIKDEHGVSFTIKHQSVGALSPSELEQFDERLQLFGKSFWRGPKTERQHRWDMAILVNPDEKMAPSDPAAVRRMIKAAAKVGIAAETITAEQANQISHYDALFIRETTAIDHHTFRLARKAEQEGLVVIDDPTSILRCCNKVFLHDAFSYNNVPSLKTRIIMGCSDEDINYIENNFTYPLVLKLPESCNSTGVFKVDNRQDLKEKLISMLKQTTLILVQEYLFTEFDWRVGVLNGRAIYACKYFMARNSWKIYNHESKKYAVGGYETVPTFEVPKEVLDAAIKAAAPIGRGLYGVDIKQSGQQVYVIEVNDSPSIDHKVEDAYLGDELYTVIMTEFARRLDQRGR